MGRGRCESPRFRAFRPALAAAVGPDGVGCGCVLRPPGGGAARLLVLCRARSRPRGQEASPVNARRRAVPAVEAAVWYVRGLWLPGLPGSGFPSARTPGVSAAGGRARERERESPGAGGDARVGWAHRSASTRQRPAHPVSVPPAQARPAWRQVSVRAWGHPGEGPRERGPASRELEGETPALLPALQA